MFDEQPDGDPHGECAAEIHRLEAENARFRAVFADVFSVRDQFAAKALAALLTRIDTVSGDYVTNATPDQAAEGAYHYADAMMRARASSASGLDRTKGAM
jgi:hypothetical protein